MQTFDPRANSVNGLRLLLAMLVLVSHAAKFRADTGPIQAVTDGVLDLGTVAVDGFFALSGFLIVGSFVASPSTGRYLWRRCLRILPGFWVCLLVTAFVLLPIAALIEFGTLRGFPLTGELSALSYLSDNAALLIRQYQVRGLFGGGIVNGSLYTLFYEFVCYLGVAVLGVVGLVRRWWPLVAVAALAWSFSAYDLLTGGGLTGASTTLDIGLRFGLMFVFGAVLNRLAHRVPMTRLGGVLAAGLFGGGIAAAAVSSEPAASLLYPMIAGPGVAYLVMLAASSTRLRRIGSRRDLSYGLYVYTWPVQALLVTAGAASWPFVVFVLVSLLVSLTMALASWHGVEAPALRLKEWSPGRRTPATPWSPDR